MRYVQSPVVVTRGLRSVLLNDVIVYSPLAGGRNVFLRRTDKMERPQLDRKFQYVYCYICFSKEHVWENFEFYVIEY